MGIKGSRAVNPVWGILVLVALIVLVVAFLIYPAYVIAVLLIFAGLGLTGAAGVYFPAHLKVAGIAAGIILMLLGAILAIVAASHGTLVL